MQHNGYLFNNFGHVIQSWTEEGRETIYTYSNDGIVLCVSFAKEDCFEKMNYIKSIEV